MKTVSTLVVFCLTVHFCNGQTGTLSNPFTSLSQASLVTTTGTYYFDLSGTKFSTIVDNTGWVQLAIDFGNGSGNLPASSALTSSARGILSSTVLAKLTETKVVRISSSTGKTNVTSTNATIISRVKSNTTLHQGTADNTINDDWIGTGKGTFTGDATCTTSYGTTLDANIIHPCGNGGTFHWIPNNGNQTENWGDGEVANATSFMLWVRSAIVVPIKLLSFSAVTSADNSVMLNWTTAIELNNNYFTIERSHDGSVWEIVSIINGAGNSEIEINYTAYDKKPYEAVSYYRLKQTDFDGLYSYSSVRMVNVHNDPSEDLRLFPNPATGKLTIEAKMEIESFRIFNSLGQDVTNRVKIILKEKNHITININDLAYGMYIFKTKKYVGKLYKN